MLLNAHGVNRYKGATLFDKTEPCFTLTEMIATIIAKNRLENTQNAADGNNPSGAEGVGLNVVVIISSYMYPHVR